MSRFKRHCYRALFFLACASSAGSMALAGPEDVIKSPNDDRDYRVVHLDNGLQVMLVHDAETDQSAASLDVAVGSGSDPYNRQGMAHFLEHMLFLGTEKYPEPGEYHKFISDHGGHNNAYTSFDHTNYFFAVEPEFLEPALDRFAQFFIAPRFNPEFIQRERTVVHSEYTGKKKEAGRRMWSAYKEIFNPHHPMRKFSVGSLSTLADRTGGDIRAELIRFYERHYSANIMKLAIVGRDDLDTLEAWVREKFEAVLNRDLSPQRFSTPLFRDDSLPAELRVKTLRDQRSMTMTFPLFSLRDWWHSKPASYIGHIVGHEGENSLLSLLKANGWAQSLSAGLGLSTHSTSTFQVSVVLTPEGANHVDEIVGLTLRMIELVKNHGIQQWIFEESRTLSDIAFKFQEKTAAAGLVRSLAARLHDYPAQDVLRAGYAHDHFLPDLIRLVLDRLTADNMILTVSSPNVETDRKTVWFDAEYAYDAIDSERLQAFVDVTLPESLKMPVDNPFIPRNTQLLSQDEAGVPAPLLSEPGFEAWYDLDAGFAVPKAGVYFSVRSANAHDTPEHAVLSDVFVRMLNEQLNEYSYPATLAGLDYSLYAHMRGFSARVKGYADSQEKLVARLTDAINNPEFDAQRFERARGALERSLRNAADDPPYEQVLDEVHRLVMSALFSRQSMIDASKAVDIDALQAFVPELLAEIDVMMLIHGNVPEDVALSLAQNTRDALLEGRVATSVPGTSVVDFDVGAHYRRELDVPHDDSAITVYMQGDAQDVETRARFALLSQIIQNPFYDQLRTQEQLGYYVFATPMTVLDVPAIGFTVQSPTTEPAALERRIEVFLNEFVASLDTLADDEYERQQAALVARITEKETKLAQRTDRYWRELDRRKFDFDSRERIVAAIEGVGRADFAAFAESVLTGAARKRLVVYATGSNHESRPIPDTGDGVMVSDADSFKRERTFFPSVQSADDQSQANNRD